LGAGSRWLEYIVLTLLSLAVLVVESIGLTLTFVTSRSISNRLAALIQNAVEIGEGRFSPLAVPQSKDEIGQLADAVSKMGDTIRGSYSELEARVRARTAELAHSRDHLNAILKAITDGITVIDERGHFVYANETGARMCGAPSVGAFLATPQAQFFENLEIRDEEGNPFPMSKLPSKLAFAGVENPPRSWCARVPRAVARSCGRW